MCIITLYRGPNDGFISTYLFNNIYYELIIVYCLLWKISTVDGSLLDIKYYGLSPSRKYAEPFVFDTVLHWTSLGWMPCVLLAVQSGDTRSDAV